MYFKKSEMVPKAGIVNSYNLLLLWGFSISSYQSTNDLYNKKSLVAIPNIGVLLKWKNRDFGADLVTKDV